MKKILLWTSHLLVVTHLMMGGAWAARSDDAATTLSPGPAEMSPEEKALAPDPAMGMQHGVVLVKEIEIDEQDPKYSQTAFHLRAKIFSSEGRGLADIELPYDFERVSLVQWWGRTIPPEGPAVELKREDLQPQMLARSRGREVKVLKGNLPGVVPGCVIDYGYVIRDDDGVLSRWSRVSIQENWPIRQFSLRWLPWRYLSSTYLAHTKGLPITGKGLGTINTVTGANLPALPAEPLMPPEGEAEASVDLLYFNKNEDHADFWNSSAKVVARRIDPFLSDRSALEGAIRSMSLPAGATLDEKLRAAYDWLLAKVKTKKSDPTNSVEFVIEGGGRDEPGTLARAGGVLTAGEGTDVQIDMLFVGIARALGADASLVFASDRTDHYWDKSVLALSQLDESLVAVRDAAGDSRVTLCDPDSRLPYGQIPWWISGPKGLLVSADGSKEIPLPVSEASQNLTESRVEISFAQDDRGALSWSASMTGQSAYDARAKYQDLDGAERETTLERMCGASDTLEVSKSETAGTEGTAPFRLACAGTLAFPGLDRGAAEVSLSLTGPWIPDLPLFTGQTRMQPVVFDYPEVQKTLIVIEPPAGFRAAEPPPAIDMPGPFGSYRIEAVLKDGKVEVHRDLTLTRASVAPEAYRGLRKFFEDIRRADATPIVFKAVGKPS